MDINNFPTHYIPIDEIEQQINDKREKAAVEAYEDVGAALSIPKTLWSYLGGGKR